MTLTKDIMRKNKAENLSALRPAFFQPKLSVNQPGDIYEQEADAMADRVMGVESTAKGGSFFTPSIINAQRKCSHCEEEEKMQRKESSNNEQQVTGNNEAYISSLNGKGSPLSQSERNFFEPRMGYDFSNVRIHTGSDAEKSAGNINALAYTHGNNIVFNTNQYQPGTDSGKRLLAHELTHTIQQRDNNTVARVPTRSGSKDGRYNFSANCGWIDWSHAEGSLATELIKRVQQASDALQNAGTNAAPTTGDVTSPAMTSKVPKAGVVLSSATVSARILQPLNKQQVLAVALGIFKKLSIAFEAQQLWTDLIGDSSFAQEDLPSDLLSFYMAAKNYTKDDIKKYCAAVGGDESVAEYDRNHDFKKNRSFTPVGATGAWPAELSTIDDSQVSSLYTIRNINGTQGTDSFNFCPLYRIEGTINESDFFVFSVGGTTFTAADNVRVVPNFWARPTVSGTYGSTTEIQVEPYGQADFAAFAQHKLKSPLTVPVNVLVCLDDKGNKI